MDVFNVTPDRTNGGAVDRRSENPPSSPPDSQRDRLYATLALLLTALLGTAGALAEGLLLSNAVLLDAALTLGLAAGVLVGVAAAQSIRAHKRKEDDSATGYIAPERNGFRLRLAMARRRIRALARHIDGVSAIRFGTGVLGVAAVVLLLVLAHPAKTPASRAIAIAAGLCLVAAGLAATAARYFADADRIQLPEGLGLSRGARVTSWILLLGALSLGLQYEHLSTILRSLHLIILAVNAAICISLIAAKRLASGAADVFPLDLGLLSLLGGRANILGSMLDSAQRQLGIDLRSTWALAVLRRSIEPLIVSLCLMGWLATSFTVIGAQDQGLMERLGVPLAAPLQSGLHVHWPWPIDRVIRVPVRQVQVAAIGHGGEENAGPINMLWTLVHSPYEYYLVLGNGRDLVTFDADIQYQIVDAHAWHYNTQDPEKALEVIAYRAVMRNTVDKTLTKVISENMLVVAARMRNMVQQDADAQGLGVKIIAFTIGGMQPPVPVAAAYEGVVSAQLGIVTAIAGAEAYRNETVPEAAAAALANEDTAKAAAAEALATADGQAWSFRTLESQYRVAKQEFFFRRRLETLENVLDRRPFTIIDSRILRDGGELWLTQ